MTAKKNMESQLRRGVFLFLCLLPMGLCQVRMSASLRIECRVSRDIKFDRVIAIRLHKLTSDGIDELIASAGMYENGAVINSPKEGVKATSNVAPMLSENFLEVMWENPTSEQSGDYLCEIEAMTANGYPVKDESKQYVLSAGSDKTHTTSPSPPTRPRTTTPQTTTTTTRPQNITWPTPVVKVVYDLTNQSTLADLASTQPEFAYLQNVTHKEGFTSCGDLDSLPDGQYVITVSPNKTDESFDVLCDIINGSAWTVFQKRFDGSVDFYKDYQNYTEGFGDITGELWLGLNKIHQLTKDGRHQLRLDMMDREENTYKDIYNTFWVGSEEEGFPLKIYGTMKGMGRQADWRFATFDKGATRSCVKEHHGGWWYSGCGDSNLNGMWGVVGPSSMFWGPSKLTEYNPMVTTEMKFNTV